MLRLWICDGYVFSKVIIKSYTLSRSQVPRIYPWKPHGKLSQTLQTLVRKITNLLLKFQSEYQDVFLETRTLLGESNGTPLQCSCLENPMDGGAWWAAVHGVAKSRTWLSDFTFAFHFHTLEKEMATHSSVLAWRIPGTGEPGGLPSMGLHRVGHDWNDLAAAAAAGLYYW